MVESSSFHHKLSSFKSSVSVLGQVRSGVSGTAMLDSQRTDFRLLRAQLGSPLGHKGVQEGLTFLKKEILKMLKQAILICLKTRQAGSRLNRGL